MSMQQLFPEGSLVFACATFPARTDRHLIGDTVLFDGQPGVARVALFHRYTLELIAVTTSDADGKWRIGGINEYPLESLFVVGLDDTKTYNLTGADYVTQEAEDGV